MSFDLKSLLEKSGAFIAVAEAARDGIVERINKEIEHKLKDAEREIEKLNDLLHEKEAALISVRESLKKAEMENIRLKMQATEPEKK